MEEMQVENKQYEPLVLIVDNDKSSLTLLSKTLKQNGCRVLLAHDGSEALKSVAEVAPNLILIDASGSDIDGIELCRQMKSLPETQAVPVILITSLTDTHSKLTGLEAGAVDYVTKPILAEEVIARVSMHLKLTSHRDNLSTTSADLSSDLGLTNQQLDKENRGLRRALEESIAREREYRAIVEHSPDNIARYDRECHLMYLNPRKEEMLGANLSELKGNLVVDVYTNNAENVEEFQENMQEVMDTGQSVEFELTLPGRETGKRYLNIRLVPEYDKHGQIVGVLTIGRDISEQKAAKKKLYEQQQVLIAAVENSPDLIARYDCECRRIYLNSSMRRAFGKTSEQMIGLTPMDGSKISHPDAYQEMISRTLETGEDQSMELSYFDEGEERYVDIRFAPEFGPSGEVVSVLSVGRDVTERYALERENALFVAMAENAVDTLIFAHSLDVGAGLPLIYYNPSYARHFGYSNQEMQKLCVCDFTPYSREELSAHMDALRKEKSLRLEAEHIRKNGDYVPVEVIMHYLEYDGEELAAGYCIDISERKAAEHKLRENKNALRENERKFRTLAENITDNIARYDLECRVVYANPQLESLIVPVFGPMLGKKPTESASDWPHVQKYQEAIEHVITTGDSASIEVTITPPDQSVQIHQINVVAERRPNGVMRGALAIGRDITSLKETEKRLEESHAQLQDITKRRETAQEEERKHIARELHDDLGQYLTALSLQATALQVGFGRKNRKHEKMIEHIIALIDGMKQSVRNLSHRLRPEALRMGLNAAIECLAVDILSQSGIDYATELYKNIDEIGDAGTAVVYRVTQESLTNIVRYAEAKHVSISLERRDDQFVLIIGDDGKGFDTSMVKPTSFGLIGMRERLQAIGGELEIISETQLGTTIIAYIPVL